MKTKLFILFILLSTSQLVVGQHTFSIIAFDSITRQVGGAGATCYQTVNDIADVHPGVGFIHTQSYMNVENQKTAKNLMDLHFSPQQIIDSLKKGDVEQKPSIRQYAVIDLLNGGRAAEYTGNDCFDYKGSRVGKNYVIIGNILSGPEILDSMETRFKSCTGSLENKLMAAMQGAKIPGADKRCVEKKVSSLSAYIIVANPTDKVGAYYLNLNIENVYPAEPIDKLQSSFNSWLAKKQN